MRQVYTITRALPGREVGSSGQRSFDAFRAAIQRRFGADHIPSEFKPLSWNAMTGWSDGVRDPLQARAGFIRRQLQQIVAQQAAFLSDAEAAQKARAAEADRRHREQLRRGRDYSTPQTYAAIRRERIR